MARDATPWAFLREWWAVLRLCAKPKPRHGSLQVAFRSIAIVQPPGRSAEAKTSWIQQRDALELVFLQLAVDQPAFMAMAREYCETHDRNLLPWTGFHPDAVPRDLELVLEFYDGDDAASLSWVLSTLLEPVALKDRSPRFRNARQRILSMEGGDVIENWTIPVTIGLWFRNDTVCVPVLEQLAALQQPLDILFDRANEETRHVALREYPFRLTYVDLAFDDGKISEPLVQALDRVVTTRGLHLRDIRCVVAERQPRKLLGDAVLRLMHRPSSSADVREIEARLTLVGASPVRAMAMSQFLSALPGSHFQSVSLVRAADSLDPDDRKFVWLWIAHSFFSPAASRTISALEIYAQRFKDVDMTTLRSYLDARNPTALLCHSTWRLPDAYDSEYQPPKRVALAEGVQVHLDPLAAQREESSLALPSTGWFDVVQENDQFVDVIVPAYAQCRVRKDDVTAWQELAEADLPRAFVDHSIRSRGLQK